MPIQTFPITLVNTKQLTSNVKHFVFQVNQDFDYIPGQFISIHFEHEGQTIKRSYSIASPPNSHNQIEISVAAVEGGAATQLLFNLSPGDNITASGPYGRLILRDEPTPKRFLFVATGTGATPYRAMLPQLAEKMMNEPVDVIMLHGIQKREDVLFGDEFLAFQSDHPHFTYFTHYSRETLTDPMAHEKIGYVQTAFSELNLNPESDIVYLCGNPNMIDDAFERLKSLGFPTTQVRREKYVTGR